MKRKPLRQLSECPNCGSIWGVGSQEWEWQQCDACGWPDADEDYNDEYDPDDDDYDSYCEDNNPNDSRSL